MKETLELITSQLDRIEDTINNSFDRNEIAQACFQLAWEIREAYKDYSIETHEALNLLNIVVNYLMDLGKENMAKMAATFLIDRKVLDL